MPNPQPNAPVRGGAVPYITVDGAIKATEFYKKAFGAEVAQVHAPDDKGRTMHGGADRSRYRPRE